MKFNAGTLDEFIAESDRRGGPGTPECESYWAEFSYSPSENIDPDLDPYGDAYLEAQVRVYREISGRDLDQYANELTHFDVEAVVAAPNAYNHPSPREAARHFLVLSKACKVSAKPRGASVLDMGCGWGFSSELLAKLGYKVTSVDINPMFVDLLNRRAKRLGYDISASQSSFDDYIPSQTHELIFFYESLHHALRPWTVLERLSKSLSPSGSITLAGEPINDIWWKSWGIRLDAISVYCIKKYGWFESGWSMEFICDVLARCNLVVSTYFDADPDIGPIIVAERKKKLLAYDLLHGHLIEGFSAEGPYLISDGKSRLRVRGPNSAKEAELVLYCFRSGSLAIDSVLASGACTKSTLLAGKNSIRLPLNNGELDCRLVCETWIPDDELKNGDRRTLSFHLESIEFVE